METKEFSFTYHFILHGIDLKDAQERLQEKLNLESESRDVLIAEQWGAEEVQRQYSQCPKCGGTLNGGDIDMDGGEVWRPLTCEKCGFTYREVYSFVQNETLDSCVPLDAHGEIIDPELHDHRLNKLFGKPITP